MWFRLMGVLNMANQQEVKTRQPSFFLRTVKAYLWHCKARRQVPTWDGLELFAGKKGTFTREWHYIMLPECKQHIIDLFNAGVLSVDSAEWYSSQGYALVCHGGRVVDMAIDLEE